MALPTRDYHVLLFFVTVVLQTGFRGHDVLEGFFIVRGVVEVADYSPMGFSVFLRWDEDLCPDGTFCRVIRCVRSDAPREDPHGELERWCHCIVFVVWGGSLVNADGNVMGVLFIWKNYFLQTALM